jgi:Cation transport ATPase
LNLVTDVFPAFALAMGEGEADVLNRPPRDPKEPILGRADWLLIVLHGVALTVATFGALALAHLWLGLDEREAVTVTFLTLAFAQLWQSSICVTRPRISSAMKSLQSMDMGRARVLRGLMVTAAYVPSLSDVLHVVAPDSRMWTIILTMSLAPLLVGPFLKSLASRYEDNLTPARRPA